MLGYTAIRYLLDLSSGQHSSSCAMHDDLRAAAASKDLKVSSRRPLTQRLGGWLADRNHRAPETLDRAIARLAALSPHLLDDIGVQVTPAVQPAQAVPVRRNALIWQVAETSESRMTGRAQAHGFAPAIAAE